jgi:hypothetical protein
LTAGAFGYKSAGGHQFAYLGAFAIGASRGFLAEDQTLEPAAAALALVFENRHIQNSLGPTVRKVEFVDVSAEYFKKSRLYDWLLEIKFHLIPVL